MTSSERIERGEFHACGAYGARVLLACVAALAAGCGSDAPAPTWTRLAEGFTPAPAIDAVRAWGERLGGLGASRDDASEGVWIEYTIERDAWRRLETTPNGFYAPRPDTAGFKPYEGESVVFRADGEELSAATDRELTRGELPSERIYSVSEKSVLLRLPAGDEELPARCTMASYLERGRSQNGAWRAAVAGIVGDGLSVWSGERAARDVRFDEGAALRFRFVARGLSTDGRVTYSVALDERVLCEGELALGDEASIESRTVALGASGESGSGRLVFRVDGDPAVCAFLDPVVGPLEIGRYGARPWKVSRPDIVLFVADTFRADNLAAWGQTERVAPRLDRLAEESARFLRTRATSVWTLPTHGSMFTGLFPMQHGAVTSGQTFSSELETLAELLARHGYRTGAITEGIFVSRRYELDQGFAWFQESEANDRLLKTTLANALDWIEHDDGRPLFAFVHTYRVHGPYRTGPEEDESRETALLARVGKRVAEWRAAGEPGEMLDVVREFVPEYHGLYLEGVRDLDAQLAPWLDRLDALGIGERAYFVFTSDHGEEFYEHGARHHAGAPHEEKVRVPLLLRGPGVAPRDVLLGASHVDLAPTIAELARVPALDAWAGRSLLSLDADRPLVAHHLKPGDREYLSIFQGEHKLFFEDGDALLRGDIEAAYDLDVDPNEQRPLGDGSATWPTELLERFAPLWPHLSTQVEDASGVELDAEAAADMKRLGYAE